MEYFFGTNVQFQAENIKYEIERHRDMNRDCIVAANRQELMYTCEVASPGGKPARIDIHKLSDHNYSLNQ